LSPTYKQVSASLKAQDKSDGFLGIYVVFGSHKVRSKSGLCQSTLPLLKTAVFISISSNTANSQNTPSVYKNLYPSFVLGK